MKIGLLHYSSPPVIGGVEKILARHAELMLQQGHSVRVITGEGARWHPGIEVTTNPLIGSRDPRIREIKTALDCGIIPEDFSALAAEIESFLRSACSDLEVLVAHNVCSLDKNLPLTAALKKMSQHHPAPALVLWHHDLALAETRSQASLHPGYPWDLLDLKWPGARHVTISELRRREIALISKLPPSAITVIPNGIDLADFLCLDEQTSALTAKLALLESAPLILVPVRITRRKNIELGIAMLAELRRHVPGARLLVTGPLGAHNPANAEYLNSLCCLREDLNLKESVHFLAECASGPVPDAVIAGLYRIADALFLPSTEEGFGIPLIEAAAAKVPVFSSDIPALRELGGIQARYFPYDAAPLDVAQLLAEFFAGDSAFNFSARVKKHFQWSQVAREHIQPLLEEMAVQ